MSEESNDSQQEWPRLWAKVTPSGIRVDLIACFQRILDALEKGEHDKAKEFARVFREVFTACALGRYELIDEGYEKAVIASFENQLADDEGLSKLLEEGK